MARREHDFYPTPSWATHVLLQRVPIAGDVLEPCVGRGDILRELAEAPAVSCLTSNDLDRARPAFSHADATDPAWWSTLGRYDWIVTNPPFGVAHKILPLAHQYCGTGVAMLLRITYLEPCEGRLGFLATYPPTSLIVLPRISFTGDGKTDNATCAWFVWQREALRQSIEIVPDPRDLPGELLTGAA
jgi:hypothetical protein